MLVGAGGLFAVLLAAARRLRFAVEASLQTRSPLFCLRFRSNCRGASFLSLVAEFRCASFRRYAGFASTRRRRPEPAAPVSGNGDSSPYALPRIRGIHRAVRLRAASADHEISRRDMDPRHPPLDHGYLWISHLRKFSRRALGLLRPWLGTIRSMGSSRKCT